MPVIACVDLDAFLVNLVRRVRPDDEVVEVDLDDLQGRRRRRYAAIVVGAAAGTEAAGLLEHPRLAPRTVVVTQAGDHWTPPAHAGPVVRRPVDPAELRVALARVVPSGRFGMVRAWLRSLPISTTPDGVFGVARITAATAAAALSLTDPMGTWALLVAAVVAWVVLRVWIRDTTVGLVAGDVAVAALALAASSGPESPFVLLAVVVAAEVGYAFRPGSAAVVITAATLAGLGPIAAGMAGGTRDTTDVVGWATLLPLSSVVGVLAQRIRSNRTRGHLQQLSELHATLDRLSKQAQGVPGTLEASSVVDQLLATLREDLDARAAILLLGDGIVHALAGSFGLEGEVPSRVMLTGERRGPGLPPDVMSALPPGQRRWSRLRGVGVDRGMVLVVVPDPVDRQLQDELDGIAAEATIALDNARLFGSIRELTIDEERRRLARDLHDGVIQSLVHVRFELDLVRRMLEPEAGEELERLRDVVAHAVEEVRATVNGLRSVRLSAGLGTALMALVREYQRPGLRVVADAAPVDSLTPEAELQLLRIAQEAVSNAVQHGKSSVVYIRLWERSGQVRLEVIDDGIGMDNGPVDASRGVGLRAMQERADLLGASLEIGPGADGGTCVQVEVSVGRRIP